MAEQKSRPILELLLLSFKKRPGSMAIEGLGEKNINPPRYCCRLAGLDSVRAKATYQLLFQAAEEADLTATGSASIKRKDRFQRSCLHSCSFSSSEISLDGDTREIKLRHIVTA